MNKTFKANFIYEGIYENLLPKIVKDALEHQFMKEYNEVIDLVNPNYENWNARYEEVKSEDADDYDYGYFIKRKQDRVFKEYNKKTDRFFNALTMMDEDLPIIALSPKMMPNVKMHFTLTEV